MSTTVKQRKEAPSSFPSTGGHSLKSKEKKSSLSQILVIGLVATLVLAAVGGLGYYWSIQPKYFTPQELSYYNGENGAPIYLAVKGRVYDVSIAPKNYGPGDSMHDRYREMLT